MNKYMEELAKLHGAVRDRVDPFNPSNLLHSSSPGVNWLFGRTHGMPFGYTVLTWGVRKAGKSLLLFDWIGQLHKEDPDALAIKFDAEFRDEGQLSEDMARAYGIDLDRYLVFSVNRPEHIFDRINTDIAKIITKGGKVKLIGVDSLNGVLGRRESDQESVTQHQIGDHAITLQIGLKSIVEVQRHNKIALVLTAHARDEMDRIEIMRGNKKRPAVANAVLHFCEFIVNIEKNATKDGRKDALGREFSDASKEDMAGDAEQTGHRVRVWMQDNSMGPKNRQTEFTLDYTRGIVNQYEEVFTLGVNWGIIQRPKKGTYIIGSQTFHGKPATLEALESSPELQKTVLQSLLEREKDKAFINTANVENNLVEE